MCKLGFPDRISSRSDFLVGNGFPTLMANRWKIDSSTVLNIFWRGQLEELDGFLTRKQVRKLSLRVEKAKEYQETNASIMLCWSRTDQWSCLIFGWFRTSQGFSCSEMISRNQIVPGSEVFSVRKVRSLQAWSVFCSSEQGVDDLDISFCQFSEFSNFVVFCDNGSAIPEVNLR